MEIPSFQEFLDSIDREILFYDLERFSTERLKTNYNPFAREKYLLMMESFTVVVQAELAQYHQWLFKKLRDGGVI